MGQLLDLWGRRNAYLEEEEEAVGEDEDEDQDPGSMQERVVPFLDPRLHWKEELDEGEH